MSPFTANPEPLTLYTVRHVGTGRNAGKLFLREINAETVKADEVAWRVARGAERREFNRAMGIKKWWDGAWGR